MKFVIPQEDFSQALSYLNHVVSSKPNLPVLGNILISAKGEELKLSSTNMETAVLIKKRVKVVRDGTTTFPARVALEFTSQLPKGEITVELLDSQLSFTQGKFKAGLATIPAEEFPSVPDIESKEAFVLDGEVFARALSQVVFSAAPDEGRPVLTGVLWQKTGGDLTMVATDGYRLSYCKTPVPKNENDFSIIVPAKTLFEVVRLLQENKGKEKKLKVFYKEDQNQIGFESQGTLLVSRLIEGQFPDWERIVPKEFKTKAVLDKEEFLQAVKITAVFARDSGNIIKLTPFGNNVTLRANASQIGENESQAAAKVTGTGEEIAFNFRYVVDALSAIPTEKVVFEMIGALNPAIFRPEGKVDQNFYHIVMPVRVQG